MDQGSPSVFTAANPGCCELGDSFLALVVEHFSCLCGRWAFAFAHSHFLEIKFAYLGQFAAANDCGRDHSEGCLVRIQLFLSGGR